MDNREAVSLWNGWIIVTKEFFHLTAKDETTKVENNNHQQDSGSLSLGLQLDYSRLQFLSKINHKFLLLSEQLIDLAQTTQDLDLASRQLHKSVGKLNRNMSGMRQQLDKFKMP